MQQTKKKDVAVQTDIGEQTEKLHQDDDGLNDTVIDDIATEIEISDINLATNWLRLM